MLKKFNKFFIKRVIALFVLFFIINVAANLPSLNIFVDIFSHFKVQYFYISFFFHLFIWHFLTKNLSSELFYRFLLWE